MADSPITIDPFDSPGLNATYAQQIEEYVRNLLGEHIFYNTDAYNLVRALAGLESNTYYLKKKFPELRDLDKFPDEFLPLMEQEFVEPCLRDVIVDKREFIRENRMFYSSKTTRQLFKWIGAALGLEVDIFEASKLILRTSHAPTVLSGRELVTGEEAPVPWRSSELGRIRDGIIWSYYVYMVTVEGGSADTELLRRFLNCIHPAGTQAYWELSDFQHILPDSLPYDIVLSEYRIMFYTMLDQDPYDYLVWEGISNSGNNPIVQIIPSYSSVGEYQTLNIHTDVVPRQ